MNNDIKSGRAIVQDFFASIETIPDVDRKVTAVLAKLYTEKKLTDRNIANTLAKMREDERHGQDK